MDKENDVHANAERDMKMKAKTPDGKFGGNGATATLKP
jgi:hypothetical protein